jgi:hypothetical protein
MWEYDGKAEKASAGVRDKLQQRLRIPAKHLEAINGLLLDPDARVIGDLLDVVAKYGSPEEINRKAEEARQLPALLKRVEQAHPEYLADLEWLAEQRDSGAFISIADYRRKVLGDRAEAMTFRDGSAVTLEISACQYSPWLVAIAKRAIERGELVPGRFIRVRNMKEQEADGDLPAFAAAMQIIGASYVEALDTSGADGSNIHLGGPDTIIGYYGGVGQPNDYPLRWLDEYLYYYTNYGVRQVLMLNSGVVLVGYLLYQLGVDIEFKISVSMGNDNPYAALWTLLAAKLLARDDGTSPLVGFNWSNSVTNETIEITAQFRRALGFEKVVRFEHHVTEAWRGIVIQPYNRRQDVIELANHVANISAKHEGGDPEIEQARERPSDINDYYREKDEIIASGDWEHLTLNFLDKFDAVNRTAWALTERGLSFVAAQKLHR